MKKVASVDEYIASRGEWQETLLLIREVFASTRLEETIKWGMPVFTLDGKNIAGFSSFKSWTGIWFYQGVFLKDSQKVLINAQEGTTKGLRQWRFTSASQVRTQKETILSYLKEAIQNQKEGKEIKPARNKAIDIPAELKNAFTQNPALKDAFSALSLSKQREYAEHVGSAKQAETREKRLNKVIPMILEGIGLSDKYRK